MTRLALTVAILWMHAIVARGAEPQAIQPVLPVNEAVLAKVKALKANQAVLLGKAEVVGEFNDVARAYNLHKTGPMGRDFTIKMVWAPERRRALFGGANHGVPRRVTNRCEKSGLKSASAETIQVGSAIGGLVNGWPNATRSSATDPQAGSGTDHLRARRPGASGPL